MRHLPFVFLLFIFGGANLGGQSVADSLWLQVQQAEKDTARINALQVLAKELARRQLDSALAISRQSLILAEAIEWEPGQAEAWYQMGRIQALRNELDSARLCYQRSLPLAEATGKRHLVADNYYYDGNVLTNLDRYAEGVSNYQKALAIYRKLGDETTIMRLNINISWVLSEQGQYPEAAELLYEAIELAEKNEAPRSIFNARHELGYVFMQMGKLDEALEIFLANEAMAPDLGDPYKKSVAYGDLGLYYAEVGDYEAALSYDLKDLAVQEEMGETKDLPLIYNNISANYLSLERYEQAILYLERSLALEGQHRAAYNRILSTVQLGLAYRGLGQLPASRRYLESALEQALDINNPQLIQDARKALVETAVEMKDYRLAHTTSLEYHQLRDSLTNLEKNRQLDELRTQYEAEKQAQQIELLQKDATINEAKRRQLFIALLAVILLGGMVAFSLWQKRRKDQRIFAQEQAIEQERRRNAELRNEQLNRELDFKKQELAAKVLQLCKKNEFLHELEKQVANLPAIDQAGGRQSSAQLSRLIQRDLAAEEDWDGFIQTFTAVHPSFFRDLHQQHGDLTKSELRLACLLRMNLSSKDISNLLNISQEGVKKARYRLRKKLTLSTEQELEGYIINL